MADRSRKKGEGVDYIAKLLLIGDSSVGKSCLLMRYFDGEFTNNFITTIGIDFKIKELKVVNKKGEERTIKLQIWDTAGQERFKTITTAYYRGAHGIFLVYDVSKRESFENVSSWMKQIAKNASADVKLVLMANKADKPKGDWLVTAEEGRKEAEGRSMPYYETSAKLGTNVDEAFASMAEMIVEVLDKNATKKRQRAAKKAAFRLPPDGAEQKKGCGCA